MNGTLQSQLEALYGLERRKDKLGLEGTRALLGALGNPERRFRAVHVAGTNGKGTVCAIIERALREAGLRTGLFTSPHLVDFRERIRVGGRWADEAWLEATLARIHALPEGRDRTFFEVCTALAFAWFAERSVEWAVVEVGLGGRLDCTNVLTPELCVITSIGLDHTEILGDTLEKIAAEKAGIVKPGVPVVSGAGEGAAGAVIARTAAERGAALIPAGAGVRIEAGPGGPTLTFDSCAPVDVPAERALRMQMPNLLASCAALVTLRSRGVAIPCEAVAAGILRARWPGRFERCPSESRLWWDGAHNPDGARALAEAWGAASAAPSAMVLALSRDKDAAGMLRHLWPVAGRARLIATRARSERALPPEDLAAAARSAGYTTETAPDVASACRRALPAATAERPVLLTGSLFAVGEAMQAFGGAPGEWL